jgi:hypothetical protein
LAGPFIVADRKTRFFLNQVFYHQGFVPPGKKVPVAPEDGVVNCNIPGQKRGISGAVIVGALKVTLDNKAEVPDMIHPHINPQAEYVGIEFVPVGIPDAVDNKVPVQGPRPVSAVFNGPA